MHYLYEPFMDSIQFLIDKSEPIPLVSVASGDGYLEYHMKCKELICVDPEPDSYANSDKIYIEPKYSYVSDLIKDRPNIVGNCNLFICNAEPTIYPTDIAYDYEAIQLLKPKRLIAIYDHTEHCAGSKKFINWVSKQKILYSKELSNHSKYIGYDRLVYI